MKTYTWKYVRIVLAAAGVVAALVSCNSHLLVSVGTSEGVVVDPPDGSTSVVVSPFGGAIELGERPDAGDAGPQSKPDTRGANLGPDVPPLETASCPTGTVRVHVRDIWSNTIDPPSMKTMTSPPSGVLVIDPSSWATYGARQDSARCSYYSVCMSTSVTKIMVKAIGADSCPAGSQSGTFDLSSFKNATDVWIEYTGDDTNIRKTSPPRPSRWATAPSI